ncbi:clan AA aspartic protease [Paenibacillus frigoriresistens]|uniref:retropepsin-like aspartic protease n=1 Tax=Paenibacillus alginolyticus TaxID=59839 RepID=UPI0015646083|nr:retropepsin-like aspartic protease [Paenibacillus frigoriresistens]NRF93581.1 clan AA aspartic protease [Paenibacillus frigoriresistens]
MQIELIDELLQTSMTICYKGRSLTIGNLVIDTGAAHSLLSSDIVSEIGIKFENGDKLLRSFGIGGDEYSFQKRIDQIQMGDLITKDIPIDFGVFHDDINYINGLIGLDILKSGNMVIDLHRMEMYPATST